MLKRVVCFFLLLERTYWKLCSNEINEVGWFFEVLE